jgi:hypothetical protein
MIILSLVQRSDPEALAAINRPHRIEIGPCRDGV